MNDEERKEIESIGLEKWERYDYSEGDFGLIQKDKDELKGKPTVIDLLQEKARAGSEPVYLGKVFYVAALNTDIVLDFTTPVGE
ncbi:MAG: hypothetical protein KAT35_05105, partial [Candidatus Aenigmarchaeota archaeon]|nr:hypothetical protein [Candidatus Aenigmarchaeota archaeon]